MNNNTLIIAGSIVFAAILIAGAIMFAPGGEQGSDTIAQVPVEGAGDVEQQLPIEPTFDLEGFPMRGDPNAPVTIVEYSDYACPFCARLAQDTMPQVREAYVDSGQVRIFFKDFTVVGGERAAEAAHCAGEQGSYWEYYDKLFANQEVERAQWSDSEVHRRYAQELGLDVEAHVACFTERRYQARVAASTQEAIDNGARGTPHVFVNNGALSGAQPFEVFQQAIEAELTR